jgi:hypothetical protein
MYPNAGLCDIVMDDLIYTHHFIFFSKTTVESDFKGLQPS